MKLKIFTLLILFNLTSFSSFAVIDVKKDTSAKNTRNFKKELFSKKKKIKKRKFRLRDFFVIKRFFKKTKSKNKRETKKIHTAALLSGIFAALVIILLRISSSLILGGLFIDISMVLSAIVALILGIYGKKEIKKNPDLFKGEILSVFGIVVSTLFLAFLLFFFAIAISRGF